MHLAALAWPRERGLHAQQRTVACHQGGWRGRLVAATHTAARPESGAEHAHTRPARDTSHTRTSASLLVDTAAPPPRSRTDDSTGHQPQELRARRRGTRSFRPPPTPTSNAARLAGSRPRRPTHLSASAQPDSPLLHNERRRARAHSVSVRVAATSATPPQERRVQTLAYPHTPRPALVSSTGLPLPAPPCRSPPPHTSKRGHSPHLG